MAVVINGILCQELVAGYKEAADIMAGFSATKKYLVPWANRFTVAHGILGLSTTASIGGLITLSYPMPYPELAAESSNALSSCYARTIEIEPVGNPTQGANNIAFPYAVITVNFGFFPWSFQGLDYQQISPTNPLVYAEQHITYSSEYITIPGTAVYWQSTMTALSDSGQADWGFLVPQADLNISLKNCPYLPAQSTLNALAAPINSVAFLGVSPGYLMLRGAENTQTAATDGTLTCDYSLAFSVRTIAPWDYSYNPKRTRDATYGFWDQVVDSTGASIIDRSDISVVIPSAYQI